MKKTMLASLLLLVGFYTIAQTRLLTIEDALVNNRGSLAVKNLRGAQFLYGTEDLVYLENKDGKDLWASLMADWLLLEVRVERGATSYLPLATRYLPLRKPLLLLFSAVKGGGKSKGSL